MLSRRHSATTDRPLAAAEGRRTAAGCSSQQAAAAWAWFEHGGSTWITPSKAEALMAAKRNAKCNFAGPSRFQKELLSRTAIPRQSAGVRSDDALAKGHTRQRHSFHDDDLAKSTSYNWRFSRSCRRAPTSPHFNKDEGPDQDGAEDEEGGFQVDDEASSLLDKFEVDALYRQLHEHLSSSGSTLCTPSSTTCSAELQDNYEAQKAHHGAHRGQKPRGYFQSSNRHKPLAGATLWERDTEQHQNSNDLVRRFLRLRITSSRSTSTAPAFCRSIATADSIVDHRHHPASPKQLIRAVLPLNQTSKRQETIHDQSNSRQNTRRVSIDSGEWKTADEESGASGQHERGEFASSHRTSHQKRLDLELVGGAPPSRLHHSDCLYSKVLQPPISRLLPDMGALLGHNMDGASSTDEYGVPCTNRHRHFHKHHHIHHHHHRHYHHLQNIHQASQYTVLTDHLIAKNVDGAHVLQYPLQGGYHDPPGGRPIHDYPASLHRLASAAQAQKSGAAAAKC